MIRLIGFLLVLASASSIAAQQPSSNPEPTKLPANLVDSIESHLNETYARYGGRELQLDLYRPKNESKPLPAIVCIHGGGWFKGERRDMANLAQALAGRGFVAVTISYRLSGEAKFPAAIHDCKAAVRWLRANAIKFGIDSQRVGVTGLSAGGHLAALLTTSNGVKQLEGDGGFAEFSSAVQACVAMGAQTDLKSDRIGILSREEDDRNYRKFLGASQNEIPETYALASPRHHLDQYDPALAFVTGELDDPSTRADEIRRDLMKFGIPGGLTLIPKAPHAFLAQQKFFDAAVNVCDSFFTLHLKEQGSPPVICDLPGVFEKDARWQQIGGGYAASEGSQWIDDTLYFAAQHDFFAFQWNEKSGLSVWRDDSPEATSFRPDGKGGFYVVEQKTRRLTRWNKSGQMVELLADNFEGKKLNRPNDCTVHPDGSVWFTDPDYLFESRKEENKELSGQFVFRFDPKTGALTKVAEGFNKPNGIAFSPDHKHLFITDSSGPKVFRFPVNTDGMLGDREAFASFDEKGLDGLAFDPAGRLWVCTRNGIRIVAQDGQPLGLLFTPGKPTSIAFGYDGRVAVTTRDACWLTRIAIKPPG